MIEKADLSRKISVYKRERLPTLHKAQPNRISLFHFNLEANDFWKCPESNLGAKYVWKNSWVPSGKLQYHKFLPEIWVRFRYPFQSLFQIFQPFNEKMTVLQHQPLASCYCRFQKLQSDFFLTLTHSQEFQSISTKSRSTKKCSSWLEFNLKCVFILDSQQSKKRFPRPWDWYITTFGSIQQWLEMHSDWSGVNVMLLFTS